MGRHEEWGRVEMSNVGRPLVSSITVGRTPLMWVACRPSPCLLYLFLDAHLQDKFQFPTDPIFMVFGPRKNYLFQDDIGDFNDDECASLLVVTCDGHVWVLPIIHSNARVTRPSKRLKESCLGRDTQVLDIPSGRPLSKVQDSAQNEWDIFKDIDMYGGSGSHVEQATSEDSKDQRERDFQGSSKSCVDLDGQKLAYCRSAEERLERLNVCIKARTIPGSGRALPKVRVMRVPRESFLGIANGVCAAAFGPDMLVSLASPFGNPQVLSLCVPLKNTSFSFPTSDHAQLEPTRKPTSLLFVSTSTNSEKPLCSGAFVSQDLFHDLCNGSQGDTPPEKLLLQGDMCGKVYIHSVFQSKRLGSSILLCDLGEPIIALLNVPFYKGTDLLLIISRNGQIIAIAPKVKELENSPFLSFRPQSFLYLELRSSIAIQWKISGPVISACVFGSRYLCYCCPGVYICDLFEGPLNKGLEQGIRNMKNFVLRQYLHSVKLDVSESIGVVGKVSWVPSASSSRPLVALTAEGRLLGIEICEHTLTFEGADKMDHQEDKKTWKSYVANMEDCVKDLIDAVWRTEANCKHIELEIARANLALRELSPALMLTHQVSSLSKDRRILHRPDRSYLLADHSGGISCKLEVICAKSRQPLSKLKFEPPSPSPCSIDACGSVEIQLVITLTNRTSLPISPHWSLMLDARCSIFGESFKYCFSDVINDGYGLSPGEQHKSIFLVDYPGILQRPLFISVFLSHIHDAHKIASVEEKGEGSLTSLRWDMPIPGKSELKRDAKPENSLPGAICMLLEHFRVDILSSLCPPAQKFPFSPVTAADFVNGQEDLLGAFSGSFRLRKQNNTMGHNNSSQGTLHNWRDWALEGLIERGNLSKTGAEVKACAPNYFGMVSFSLDSKPLIHGMSHTLLNFSTSSLLLGCSIREALLWNMLNCGDATLCCNASENAEEEFNCRRGTAEEQLCVVRETLQNVASIAESIKTLANMWSHGIGQGGNLPQDLALTVAKDLLRAYKSYRLHGFSNSVSLS